MIPRWSILPAAIALVSGSLIMAAGSANAATSPTTATTHSHTTTVRPGHGLKGFVPGGLMKQHPGAHRTRHGKFFRDQSSNWSGYAASGGTGAFNSVSSSWTQPTATCNDSGQEYAAFWVGLDGFNSSSVEQTGTDSDCSGGSPTYYGWYEMYPAAPVYYTDPVSPGDSMSASVSDDGTGNYTLVLTDFSQGWTETQNISQPGNSDSSAEVITEAPSDFSGPLPLADFGTINYGGSTANGGSLSSQNPTNIIMVGASGNQLDDTSAIDGSGNFSNTWLNQS